MAMNGKSKRKKERMYGAVCRSHNIQAHIQSRERTPTGLSSTRKGIVAPC